MKLEPGIYKATVDGTQTQYQGIFDSGGDFSYLADGEFGSIAARNATNFKPLILLDLDDFAAVTTPATSVVDALRQAVVAFAGHQWVEMNILTLLADQIEAQTKPARIEEPGLWGVVEANGCQWTRVKDAGTKAFHWINDEGIGRCEWLFLVDPVLVRPGIEATP